MRTIFIILTAAILAIQISCGTYREFELERNRQRWRDSKIENYRMTFNLQKTGHAAPNGKFITTVRGGKTESVVRAKNPELQIQNSTYMYATIDNIFSYIESEIGKEDRSWSRRTLEYDAQFGYPKLVDLDAAYINDEEIRFQVLQFEVLE